MKGTSWDGSHFATKGTSRSEGRGMFSVGGLVAFETSSYCSPDGRDHASGCGLTSSNYFLQEEIKLEEFNHTESNRYGSGNYDIQKVIDLRDIFSHTYESSSGKAYYVCGICGDVEPRLPQGVAKKTRIEEVRGHAGKFLHVYEIGSGPHAAAQKASSFEEAIQNILNDFNSVQAEADRLEKIAVEKRQTLGVKFTEEGIKLAIMRAKESYGQDSYWSQSLKEGKLSGMERLLQNCDALNRGEAIVVMHKSAYYSKPNYNFVAGDQDISAPSLGTDDHFGHSVRDEDMIVQKIAKKVLLRDGRIYCGSFNLSTVIDVFQEKSGELNYDTNLYTSWCNSQSWNESVHDYTFTRFEIETGEVGAMAEYNSEMARRAEARKVGFEEKSKTVLEKYGEEILNLAKREKGKVLCILGVLAESKATAEEIKTALEAGRGKSAPVIEVLLKVVADHPDQDRVRKVTEKASAWAYLSNAGLAYAGGKRGYFDDTIEALKIYQSIKGLVTKKEEKKNPSIDEINAKNSKKTSLGDLFNDKLLGLL